MKEYTFEKDTWVIVKGDKPHGIFLEPGHSITTINEVEIFEDENLWKSKKNAMGIVDVQIGSESSIKTPHLKVLKEPKERKERIPR